MSPATAQAPLVSVRLELTVREFAATERVSERTVRRWIAKGAVAFRYTPGGGIRILERRQEPRTHDRS